MNKKFENEMSPELLEKSKKNLVYVGILSVVMLFAGFTSAYIVSMGDAFWVKYPLPKAFWVSTAVIILSSFTFELAIRFVKKGKQNLLRLFMSLTLVLGFAFVYFQFKGYKDLTAMGAPAVNNHILVTEGRYGDFFEIKYNNQFIEVKDNTYSINGKYLNQKQMSELQKFMAQFITHDPRKPLVIEYGNPFILYYRSQPLLFTENKLQTVDGKQLEYLDFHRLKDLAINIRDNRADFFIKGQLGKDFDILYKGKKLDYKDRDLLYQGRKLSKFLQLKATETADTGTTFLYLISFVHLMHIAITLIFLMRATTGSFTGKYTQNNYLSLRVGIIFWHFLGILWGALLLFLLFIH